MPYQFVHQDGLDVLIFSCEYAGHDKGIAQPKYWVCQNENCGMLICAGCLRAFNMARATGPLDLADRLALHSECPRCNGRELNQFMLGCQRLGAH